MWNKGVLQRLLQQVEKKSVLNKKIQQVYQCLNKKSEEEVCQLI
jgi:hypothetical protein